MTPEERARFLAGDPRPGVVRHAVARVADLSTTAVAPLLGAIPPADHPERIPPMQHPFESPYTDALGRNVVDLRLRDITAWKPSVQQIRDAILAGAIGAPDVLEGPAAGMYRPTQQEVETIGEMAIAAVRSGRMIDFGFLANAVIVDTSRRVGPLYDEGVFAMPFTRPWVLLHTWEGLESPSIGPHAAIYLVNPLELPCGKCEVVELESFHVRGVRTLSIGDRGLLELADANDTGRSTYRAQVAPAVWRGMANRTSSRINGGQAAINAAAGNIFDPLLTALSILSTRGIERATIRADEKLQRARVKSRKPPIPPYDLVNSAPYVTAILASLNRQPREASDGHHASPRWHLRRAHLRTLANGARSFIADTLVNVTEEARAAFKAGRIDAAEAGRAGYVVKPGS